MVGDCSSIFTQAILRRAAPIDFRHFVDFPLAARNAAKSAISGFHDKQNLKYSVREEMPTGSPVLRGGRRSAIKRTRCQR
jgi:hypothetical protein